VRTENLGEVGGRFADIDVPARLAPHVGHDLAETFHSRHDRRRRRASKYHGLDVSPGIEEWRSSSLVSTALGLAVPLSLQISTVPFNLTENKSYNPLYLTD
jgi:hypothetical protein